MAEERMIPGAPGGHSKSRDHFEIGGQKISGSSKGKRELAGDNDVESNHIVNDPGNQQQPTEQTLLDRIFESTKNGGLEALPKDFDKISGDWQVIKSDNLFEILYLDHGSIAYISPDVVCKNYDILKRFWQGKKMSYNTGGNRIQFDRKYGPEVVNNSVKILDNAFNKINTKEGIHNYFCELEDTRIKLGTTKLIYDLEALLLDEVASKKEIIHCINKKAVYNLNEDEVASVISNEVSKNNYVPDGSPTGNTERERLLSVKAWMSPEKFDELKERKKKEKATRVEILRGQFASCAEEIGTILYKNNLDAKKLIKRPDLLASAVASKNIPLSLEIEKIAKSQKGLDEKYYSIMYRLNSSLPYRFRNTELSSIEDLCLILFKKENYLKGREHFKSGLIEAWIFETKNEFYNQFIDIRDNAPDLKLAYLAFLYTFNKSLPYRFNDEHCVDSPVNLFFEIDKDEASWESGKEELYNGSILTWLRIRDKKEILSDWNMKQDSFNEDYDEGLEYFQHLLNPNCNSPEIQVDTSAITLLNIQQNRKPKEVILTVNNVNRGYTKCRLHFDKTIDGLGLSEYEFNFNASEGINSTQLSLYIDTFNFKRGYNYKNRIILQSTAGQKIEIPVHFRILFPRKKFILEIVKFVTIFTGCFAGFRYLVSLLYSEPMNTYFMQYIGFKYALYAGNNYFIVGSIMFGLLLLIVIMLIVLWKYLLRKHK